MLNVDDAAELDAIAEALAELQARCVRAVDSAYPSTHELAANVAELAQLLQAVVERLAYAARELETEPGDR